MIRMINFLNNLSFKEEDRFESLGQILDSMVQAIEEYGKQMFGEELSSRSFGELETYFRDKKRNDLAEQLSAIRTHRKTISIRLHSNKSKMHSTA